MQFKDLEVPEELRQNEWTSNKVKIKKWTLGIRNKIMGQCSKVKIIPGVKSNNTPQEFDYTTYQILTILHCVHEAPWVTGKIESIADLSPELGDWIFGEISTFNEGDIKNSTGSEESSEESAKQTQPSNPESKNISSKE